MSSASASSARDVRMMAHPYSPQMLSNDTVVSPPKGFLTPSDGLISPPKFCGGDPYVVGGSMDEEDEWGTRRRRPGLRALAEARDMSTHSTRRSRADIRARRRSSIFKMNMQQVQVTDEHPIVPFPAICVYADTLRSSTPMPQDGLCDYMFFDSFYKSGANKIHKTATNTVSLDTFLKLSRELAYATTQMGIGFAQ
ncbi:hypothetical protein MRX96_026922 [Rhipicephalus microplus]